jgi:hypothetical protein
MQVAGEGINCEQLFMKSSPWADPMGEGGARSPPFNTTKHSLIKMAWGGGAAENGLQSNPNVSSLQQTVTCD